MIRRRFPPLPDGQVALEIQPTFNQYGDWIDANKQTKQKSKSSPLCAKQLNSIQGFPTRSLWLTDARSQIGAFESFSLNVAWTGAAWWSDCANPLANGKCINYRECANPLTSHISHTSDIECTARLVHQVNVVQCNDDDCSQINQSNIAAFQSRAFSEQSAISECCSWFELAATGATVNWPLATLKSGPLDASKRAWRSCLNLWAICTHTSIHPLRSGQATLSRSTFQSTSSP